MSTYVSAATVRVDQRTVRRPAASALFFYLDTIVPLVGGVVIGCLLLRCSKSYNCLLVPQHPCGAMAAAGSTCVAAAGHDHPCFLSSTTRTLEFHTSFKPAMVACKSFGVNRRLFTSSSSTQDLSTRNRTLPTDATSYSQGTTQHTEQIYTPPILPLARTKHNFSNTILTKNKSDPDGIAHRCGSRNDNGGGNERRDGEGNHGCNNCCCCYCGRHGGLRSSRKFGPPGVLGRLNDGNHASRGGTPGGGAIAGHQGEKQGRGRSICTRLLNNGAQASPTALLCVLCCTEQGCATAAG